MSLLDQHEQHLATSLESTEKFGVPLAFTSPDGLTIYNLTGQLNIISRHSVNTFDFDDVTMVRANCTIRFASLATEAGYPDVLTWADNLPVAGWKVDAVKTALKIPIKFAIEKGSSFPDDHLGTITFFLAGLEVIS